jgi:putative ATPase
MAIDAAIADVKEGRTIPVPIELRDPNKVQSIGSPEEGEGYEYAHTQGARTSLGGVTDQSYLGVDKHYYEPSEFGLEKELKRRLEEIRAARERHADDTGHRG